MMVEKMDNIKVSVIVPVYNGEEYIQTSMTDQMTTVWILHRNY